jgi:hypothetical protein
MRRLKRRHLFFYLRVFDKENGDLIGQVIDVTTEGMQLISEFELEKNKKYLCEMTLPNLKKDSESFKIIFNAKCLWSKKDSNPNFFLSGYKIKDISNQNLLLLMNLIQNFSL